MHCCPGGDIHIEKRSEWPTTSDRYKSPKYHHVDKMLGMPHDWQQMENPGVLLRSSQENSLDWRWCCCVIDADSLHQPSIPTRAANSSSFCQRFSTASARKHESVFLFIRHISRADGLNTSYANELIYFCAVHLLCMKLQKKKLFNPVSLWKKPIYYIKLYYLYIALYTFCCAPVPSIYSSYIYC